MVKLVLLVKKTPKESVQINMKKIQFSSNILGGHYLKLLTVQLLPLITNTSTSHSKSELILDLVSMVLIVPNLLLDLLH